MLRPFDYYRPTSLEEACKLLNDIDDACILAGGTDLLVKIRDGKHVAPAVVDIKGVQELEGISLDGDDLVIGALTTITDLLKWLDENPLPQLELLREAGKVFGCQEIRHRATVCGNIAHASPGAEFGSPMYVLEATAVIHGPDGERTLPVAEFYKGPTWNALEKGELLKALRVPVPPKNAKSHYRRSSRIQGMDLASMNVALMVIEPEKESDRQVRIAMGAVWKVPLRATEVEEMLSRGPITDEKLARAGQKLSDSINPRATSLRATPEYKKAMVAHITEDGLRNLLGMTEEVAE